MAAQLAEENHISPRLVRDEIMTLLLAGFETSATTMTWAICLLERHPEAWSRMVTEVDLALGGRTPQFRDLADAAVHPGCARGDSPPASSRVGNSADGDASG